LRNVAGEISLMERCDWSVGQCVQTSNDVLMMVFTYGFRKFISSVKGAIKFLFKCLLHSTFSTFFHTFVVLHGFASDRPMVAVYT